MCSVEGCDRSATCRRLCTAHYKRLQKHGDVRPDIPLTRPRSDIGKRHRLSDPRLLDSSERLCRDCGHIKPLSDFGPLSKGPLGRKYTCRPCDALRARRDRARWKSDPERHEHFRDMQNRSRVKGAYGPDGLASYERILNGEPCDVCGQRPSRKSAMAIDHCHVTGRVRGILCKDCNLVLGWMNDDPKRLRALADYLERA